MAITNFQPTIWRAMVLESLKKNLVFGARANRNYEGDVRFGNAVKINSVGAVAVRNYEGSTTTDALSDTTQTLLINQQKYFSFNVDDINRVQSNADFANAAMVEAGYALADSEDQYIASLHGDAGIVTDLGTNSTPIEVNSANVLAYLRLMYQKMSENSVPTSGRWAIIPPWMETKIKIAAQKIMTRNDDVVTTGYIGTIEGFDLYVSNNVVNTAGAKYKVLAGYPGSITLAHQIDMVETVRDPAAFADIVRGLLVFGAKVVRANSLACLTCDIKAEA